MGGAVELDPASDWREILSGAEAGRHTVQLYSDLEFLTRAVAHYTASGLARGEAVVLVATPSHQEAFNARLRAEGWEVGRLAGERQLVLLDAAATLSRLMVNGSPQAGRFEPVIGGVIERAAGGGRFPRVRVYGEMVNLLWEQGELPAALRLEELWNELAARRPFALHCAYGMDAFDRAGCCTAIHDVHHAHSHLIPVEHYDRFDRAVSQAMADVLGPAEATVLKTMLAKRQQSGAVMPGAQAAVLGLSNLLPTAADAVLTRARRYYQAAAGRD